MRVVVAAGWRCGDPVAGFAVTLFILHVGWEVTTAMLHRLMDGVDPEHLDAARSAATAVAGVRAATVRGRWTGRSLLLDVQGQLDPQVALGDADPIGAQVRHAVHDAAPEARTVTWTPTAATATDRR